MRTKISLLVFLASTQLFFFDANAEQPPRFDGLSSTPSRHKPSQDMLCGTNNAWAMSAETVASIYGNLGRSLGLQESEIRVLCAEDKEVQQKLRNKFGGNQVACKLTLKPNGRIEKITIKKSCGSKEIDQQILEFVKSAGPFKRNEFPEPLAYAVEIPAFNVKPDWW